MFDRAIYPNIYIRVHVTRSTNRLNPRELVPRCSNPCRQAHRILKFTRRYTVSRKLLETTNFAYQCAWIHPRACRLDKRLSTTIPHRYPFTLPSTRFSIPSLFPVGNIVPFLLFLNIYYIFPISILFRARASFIYIYITLHPHRKLNRATVDRKIIS